MAIAFDAATNGGDNGGSANTHSWSHTCTGSNRLLVVGFFGDSTAGSDDITAVTYNGVAMTAIYTGQTAQADRYYYLYYLLNPASGSNTVQITAGSTHYLFGVSASYTGVAQSGQPDATNANSTASGGAPLTTSVTTVADNAWVVMLGVHIGSDGSLTAGTGATQRVESNFAAHALFDSNGPVTPAGSYSMTWDCTGVTFGKTSLLASFAPAAAGSSSVSPSVSSSVSASPSPSPAPPSYIFYRRRR